MNSFNRKALTCAVLAGLGGVATTAEAVYLNPDGTGQVLIYPYYTVNSSGGNAFNTYISVTNTTSVAKATKVRFREGRTSAEVLDFNLFLSPNDVWVGAIGPDTSDPSSAGRLFGNFETSCTYPAIPAGGQPFTNIAYTGAPDNLPGTGLDRTREGYVEIFDMATLTGALATAVTHTVIGGPPPNCAAVRVNLTGNAALAAPTGGLYGEATIINVTNGAAVGYKADALAAYQSNIYYSDVAATTPLLGSNAAPVSLVLANNHAYTDVWGTVLGAEAPAGAKAVAAVFMHTAVMNDYVLDIGTRSNTDWVLTFPGKNEFYTPTGTPFAPYTGILTTNGACETALFTFFDRDEFSANPPTTGFSPQQPGALPNTGSLCWESTVLSIRNSQAFTSASDISTTNPRSGVLGSRNVLAVSQTNPSFNAGWINMTFTGANAVAGLLSANGGVFNPADAAPGAFNTGGGATGTVAPVGAKRTFGLPVTGFMVDSRANAAISCTLASGSAGSCSGNYMTLFRHSFRTLIQ
jgi:hypothetical protein